MDVKVLSSTPEILVPKEIGKVETTLSTLSSWRTTLCESSMHLYDKSRDCVLYVCGLLGLRTLRSPWLSAEPSAHKR